MWLVKQGHESEAEQSIKRIRGEKYQQSHEIKELIMCTLVVAQPTAVAVSDPDSSPLRRRLARAKSSVESKLSVMTSPDVWKPMLLMMLLFSFQARLSKIPSQVSATCSFRLGERVFLIFRMPLMLAQHHKLNTHSFPDLVLLFS